MAHRARPPGRRRVRRRRHADQPGLRRARSSSRSPAPARLAAGLPAAPRRSCRRWFAATATREGDGHGGGVHRPASVDELSSGRASTSPRGSSTGGCVPDTLATLRRHAATAHDVVLVSASFAVYLRPLAEHLGARTATVVATELASTATGAATGALDGGNCRGDAKVERLHAWLDAHARRSRRGRAVGLRRLGRRRADCSPTPTTGCG